MRFWNFRNEEKDPDELKRGPEETETPDGALDIDGEIVAERGWFDDDGVCVAKDFRAALKGYRNVTVRINSPGGDVMAGADIYSALREHSLNGHGRVKVIITALAASAASVIAMAGDEILMSPTAYMMIHNPWTVAMGDAREMRKTAKTLDVISEGLINAYQIRTGKSRDELKRMLENETWMSAYTCVEHGFADGIFGAETEAGSRAAACLMSGKAHGWQEIAARMRAEEPEEDPEEEEEPEETEEEPEEEKPGAKAEDPDEEKETDPDEDPEEGGDPESDPEEDADGDPDEEESGDPDEEKREKAKNAARRAAILSRAAVAWAKSFYPREDA